MSFSRGSYPSSPILRGNLTIYLVNYQQVMPKKGGEAEARDLEKELSWVRQKVNYDKMSNDELQEENKRIMGSLKMMEQKLDKELDKQKRSINLQETQETQVPNEKVVSETIKSHQTHIRVLEKEVGKLKARRESLKGGLQSKLNAKKYQLEKRVGELKGDVRKMKLEEKELNKRLQRHDNASEPQSLSQNMKLQQQLRGYSIRYMKMLEKYNKVTQQLAIASNTAEPELHIPEQFYNQELQEREEAQYKQYEGIVKLCKILSKRNDSENNRFNRIYTEKLRELEKTIVDLGQIDRMVGLREGEILEGKKNIELVKYRINNNEKVDDHFLSLSQSSLRRKSYSLTKLNSNPQIPSQNKLKDTISRKLSKI